ncbi:MAG: energy-coupling factor ABC transporter permease [Deltaproteobacteria bacterium]
MHIADGILSPEVCLGAGLISAGAIGLSLRKLNETISTRTVPLTGMMASIIFAAQMVKFPLVVAPAWGHLLGGVLAAVVVGPWAGCVAISLVLFLQMALFADGGWLAYGANALNMGVVGSLGGYAVYAAIRRRVAGPRGTVAGAVVAAWISVVAASALFCVEFGLSHRHGEFDVPRLFAIMTSFHSLVGVGEALITGGVVSYLVAVRPDLICEPRSQPGAVAGLSRIVWSGAIAALAVAAFVAPFAAEGDDALEATAAKMEFDGLEQKPRPLLLADYEIPLPLVDTSSGFWQKLSVSLAGVFGTSAVLGMTVVFGRISRSRLAAREPVTSHAG